MKIDPTTTVAGGGLYLLDMEMADITAVFTEEPLPLLASTVPNTVSISYLFIDSDTGVLPP